METEKEPATEFTVPDGCSACGGEVSVKVSAHHGAYTVCKTCRIFAHPRMRRDGEQLVFEQRVPAAA